MYREKRNRDTRRENENKYREYKVIKQETNDNLSSCMPITTVFKENNWVIIIMRTEIRITH